MNNFRRFLALLVLLLLLSPEVHGYSVLTHEAIVDSAWSPSIENLLRRRFPATSAEDLQKAHAYAYGGCLIQDMGYYPLGSHFFTDLTHYVRSGDFVAALIRDARDVNEYAFALGALAHYASDTNGHPLGINRVVPMMYPKLRRKFGNEVSYGDDPGAHLKTEFGFDVLGVARGRYTSNAYRDFIGFEVSKPVLERAFQETYGLKLEDVFTALDVAIGTYRRTVSSIIPKMTRVAWELKKDEIEETNPGITRQQFLYAVSKADYEKQWGKGYKEPGFGSKLLAVLFRILPKIGPLKALRFEMPTPDAEKVFLESFNVTLQRYRELLAAEASRNTPAANVNLDLGTSSTVGMYRGSDETYAKLVGELVKGKVTAVPAELRSDISKFYKGNPPLY